MTARRLKVVIATANPGKLREFKDALSRLELDLLSLEDVGIGDGHGDSCRWGAGAADHARDRRRSGWAAHSSDAGSASGPRR